MSAPGISIAAVIDNMSSSDLVQLLGDDLVETITQLQGSLPDSAPLRKIAKSLYADNPLALQNDKVLIKIIDTLPLDKAKELCTRLDLNKNGDIYESLKHFKFGQQQDNDDALKKFFGIVDDQTAPVIQKPVSSVTTPYYGLFDYQRDVVIRASNAINNYPNKVLVHMPTGSGKTRTSMHIIARHLYKHESTLVCWLANSSELLEQAAEEIERSWTSLGDRPINVYRFWGDRNVDLYSISEGILIAGFAKMHAAYMKEQNALVSLGDHASLTVVDEAHQSIAPTYRSIIEALYTKRPMNALLGLSATPGRTWNDVEADRQLSDFFGGDKVTLAVKNYPDPVSYLIAEGYLAKPKFRTLDFNGPISILEDTTCESGELSKAVLDYLSENSQRNYMIISVIEDLLIRHRRIIVFGASVAHAHLLSGILTSRGQDTKVITGETPVAKRERFIRQYKSDNPNPMVLCNYGVLTTGFDAPKTSAAVITRPTRSLVLYSQMVGRAIRGPRAGGNKEAEIVTIVDTALPGFGDVSEAFKNWEDVWDEYDPDPKIKTLGRI